MGVQVRNCLKAKANECLDCRNIFDGSQDLSHFHSKLISDGTHKLEYPPS